MRSRILRALPEADLRVLFVWAPFLGTDSREVADTWAASERDGRVRSFWDPEHRSCTVMRRVLDLGPRSLAWDVYLFYPAGIRWGAEPPAPVAWAHQLGGAPPEHFYGSALGDMLEASARELLAHGEDGGTAFPDPADLPGPAGRIEIDASQLRPVTALLIEDALARIRACPSPVSLLDDSSWSAFVEAIVERFESARRAAGIEVPQAIRWNGRILRVAPAGPCAG